MTLLEQLQSHKGGLIRIKNQLYWYGGRGWDRSPGWVCLVLDAAAGDATDGLAWAAAQATPLIRPTVLLRTPAFAALLLIDGRPQWILIGKEDVEIL